MGEEFNPERLVSYIRQLEDVASEVSDLLIKFAHEQRIESPELMHLAMRCSRIVGRSDEMQQEITRVLNINSLLVAQSMELENKSEELAVRLEEVQRLKRQQDADYFLCAQLQRPFVRESWSTTTLKTEAKTTQKKQFKFGKWEGSIGGDITSVNGVILQNRSFVFFANADAMGKSIQGAGGALVLGAILRSIAERTKINSHMSSLRPEIWLRDAAREIRQVFKSFDGSMLLTAFLGLIDQTTGVMYYLNAEHPAPVLIRNGKCSFVTTEKQTYRIGLSPESSEGTVAEANRISKLRLFQGDVLICATDGRDDLLVGMDKDGNRLINSDESLFLETVREADGNIGDIMKSLAARGELMDDLSVLRIEFMGRPLARRVIQSPARERILQAVRNRDWTALMRILQDFEPESESQSDPMLQALRDVVSMSRGDSLTALRHFNNALMVNPVYLPVLRLKLLVLAKLMRTSEYEELHEGLSVLDGDSRQTSRALEISHAVMSAH